VDGDWDSYINFMKTQLTELITNYPGVKGIWFDGEWERRSVNWHFDEIYPLIHKLNSSILIGNNHHLAPLTGEDFQMFEKDLPGGNSTGFSGESKVGALPLETCETINNSWGFNITDRSYKSVKQIIHYLVTDAGLNCNFLLNVGPMPNGKIQKEFVDTLSKVGDWMKKNGESIYETRGNLIEPQQWGVVTAKGNTIYAHILQNPSDGYILIPSLKQKIAKITALNNGSPLKFKQQPEGVFVYTKGLATDPYDTVIKITTN
jgi:alpha-L-fucosidase